MRTIDELLLTVLLNAIWQIALVALAAAVCARLLRGAPARYRYMVWVAALSLSVFLPLLSSAQLFTPGILGPSSPVKPAAAEDINSTPAAAAQLPVRTVTPPEATNLKLPLGPGPAAISIAAYLLFVLYRGGKLLRAYLRTRTIMASAYDVPLPENIETALEKCKAVIGVGNVSVLFSRTVPVPVTTGTHRPLVILPEAFLRETDTDLLVTAIGHELVHVRRRDYLSNLIFELFYLPMSFHPAAAFLKRRIDQSREICCDEIVAAQLLKAEVYARSLVTIAGSAANSGRLYPAITVGITDAGNLEVRIMSLLERSEISSYKKSFLIIAAIILLAVPCVVAAFFVPGVGIDGASARRPEAKPAPTPPPGEEATKVEEQREKLKTALKEVEQSDLDPREKELRTEKLKEEFRSLQVVAGKLNAPAAEDERRIVEEKMLGLRESDRGLEDRKIQVEKLQRELETVAAGADTDEKKARLDELRMKLLATEGNLEATKEELRKRELDMTGKMEMEKLAREATVRMDDAARTATGREPGKVIENGIERSTDGEIIYKFVVRNDDGNKSVVVVSGRDGRVIKTEKIQ